MVGFILVATKTPTTTSINPPSHTNTKQTEDRPEGPRPTHLFMLGILTTDHIKVPLPPDDRTPITKLFNAAPNLHPPDALVSIGPGDDGAHAGASDGPSEPGERGGCANGGRTGDDGLAIRGEEGAGGTDGA